jgi:hypothetical protein
VRGFPSFQQERLSLRRDGQPVLRGGRVHFIGIGGSGMSGLARMLLDCGRGVSGSEPSPNAPNL